MTLDAWARRRDNNFDVVRLGAASLVLASHAFLVAGAHEPRVGHWPLGTLGVEIFFAISGFLVAGSWYRQPGLRAFVVKRSLRIVPALVVTVLACAFILGPVVTSNSAQAYVTSAETLSYPVQNVVSVTSGGTLTPIAEDLPGVFDRTPDHAVNRSLWTLPVEVRAYAAIALLGLLGLLVVGLPAVAVLLFLLSVAPAAVVSAPVVGSGLEFLRGTDGEAAHLIAMFAVAALMYTHRSRISLRGDVAAIALIGLVVSLNTPLERLALVVAIPYLSLFAAYRSWGGLSALTRYGDVSYGLYLFAFPVQQTIVQTWGGSRPAPLTVVLIAFPATYLLALGSWHTVEKRALGLKGALATPRRARNAARPRREAAPVPVEPEPTMEVIT